jgi:hypothetical protein
LLVSNMKRLTVSAQLPLRFSEPSQSAGRIARCQIGRATAWRSVSRSEWGYAFLCLEFYASSGRSEISRSGSGRTGNETVTRYRCAGAFSKRLTCRFKRTVNKSRNYLIMRVRSASNQEGGKETEQRSPAVPSGLGRKGAKALNKKLTLEQRSESGQGVPPSLLQPCSSAQLVRRPSLLPNIARPPQSIRVWRSPLPVHVPVPIPSLLLPFPFVG